MTSQFMYNDDSPWNADAAIDEFHGPKSKDDMAPRSHFEPWTADQLKVLWVTNMAAPYRVPLWQSLQKKTELVVALLESKSSLSSDLGANRGQDWIPQKSSAVNFLEIPTVKISRHEARYYFPRRLSTATLPRNHDVVVFGGWESPVYWLLLVSAKFHGRRCIGFYESTLATMRNRKGPVSWLRVLFFHCMDITVVPGPAARDALLSLGVGPTKITEGFNAVDVKAFQGEALAIDRNESLGHAFLYVGQLIPRKRVKDILEAFSRIAGPHDTLTILGSGEQEEELRRSAWGQEKIRFLPYIDNREMPRIMATHNTLVLASSEEVWGLVVNEALASGLHTVISQNCGVVPSVEHMAGVFVVEPGLTDLEARMAESRASWTGPIAEPEILQFTPEEFASVFMRAIRMPSAISSTR